MIYGEEAIVEEITAKKEYAIAYLNSWNEEEIIYDYSKSIGER
jgi:hypothetical protein